MYKSSTLSQCADRTAYLECVKGALQNKDAKQLMSCRDLCAVPVSAGRAHGGAGNTREKNKMKKKKEQTPK